MNDCLTQSIRLLTLVLLPCSVLADGWDSVGIGYEHTSGSYGTANDTEITTIPFIAQRIENDWRFRISVPYTSVTGDGSVVPGSHGGIAGNSVTSPTMGPGGGSGTTQVTTQTQSGLGDITTSVSYALPPKRGSYIFHELTAEIKWGTASASKNLGTGENDFSLSLYSIYDKNQLKPYLVLGYLVIGDSSLINYDDVLFARPGLIYQLDRKTSVGVSYEYEQATSSTTDDGHIVQLFANRVIDYEWSVSAYLLTGFSDSVADSGIGFTLMNTY